MLKHVHCQPSEIENLPFYELEILLSDLKAMAEKEDEDRKKQEKGQSTHTPNLDMNSQMREMSKNMGQNMPSLPNFKL